MSPIPKLGVGGHAYVISEMETDGTSAKPYFTIYDPKPAIILQANYLKRAREYPLSMYHILRNSF